MANSGQQPGKADTGGQRPSKVKAPDASQEGTGTPLEKPVEPSSGRSGAKKG